MFTRKSFKRYYIGLLIPVTLAAVYLAFSSLLLQRSGEYLSLADIAKRQERDRGLFGPARNERTFWYKQYLYNHFDPDVVAMGSSRVMQFRGELFTSSFFNLGNMSSVDDGLEMAKILFTENPPEHMVLGVDFWWFLPRNEGKKTRRSPPKVHMTANDLFMPLQWLISGKMGFGDIGRIIGNKSPNIGIAALVRNDGFDIHGSNHYNAILTGQVEHEDAAFKGTLRKIANGEKIFSRADALSEAEWKKFSDFIDFLQQKKIDIVMFMPPLAPTAIEAMEQHGKDYAYVAEVRKRLALLAQQRKIAFFDFHDPREVGAGNCEFVDGIHGGEVLYNRLLLEMATQSQSLAGTLDLPEIGWNIAHYAGQASILGAAETDFLGIGCKKSGNAAAE